jgi:hypothetical protein
MTQWYSSYVYQTWYTNTFLVRRPHQIGRAIANDREWNNIHDSGCNFTFLAMMLDIDPARLASELRTQRFFFADGSLPAKHLDGTQGGLVWDQNAHNGAISAFSLKDFWHLTLKRRVSLMVQFLGIKKTTDYDEGCGQVAAIRGGKNHIICGPDEHSHLIAGETKEGYYLWDPDGSETTVEENLAGVFTLRKLFAAYPNEKIEFWEYRSVVV